MAQSKRFKFTREHARLAEFAKALSHPARIAILRTLAERNSCICGEIVEILPLAQSTVSQHLKELKEVGLIKGEVEGPKSCYCIDRAALEQFSSMIKEFMEDVSAESHKTDNLTKEPWRKTHAND